jgi:hypothetical protein
MTFKYKLVKEVTPSDIEMAANTVGQDAMKGIEAGHLNYKDFEDLEQILGQTGIEQDKIEKILDMWAERSKFVGLNEKEEGYYKDPETGELKQGSLGDAFKAVTSKIKDKDISNLKNTLKEAILKKIKEKRNKMRS